jgi:hypothetical protein
MVEVRPSRSRSPKPRREHAPPAAADTAKLEHRTEAAASDTGSAAGASDGGQDDEEPVLKYQRMQVQALVPTLERSERLLNVIRHLRSLQRD